MNIIIANTSAYPNIGGVETSITSFAKELINMGHNVVIFCMQLSPSEPIEIMHEGIKIVREPITNSKFPFLATSALIKSAAVGFAKIAESFKPDFVWSNQTMITLAIRNSGYTGKLIQLFPTTASMNCKGLLKQNRGLPLSQKIINFLKYPISYLKQSRMESKILKICTPVVFSQNMVKNLQRKHKSLPECNLIRPSLEKEKFCPEIADSQLDEIKSSYNLSKTDNIILYAGRLSVAKNLFLLLDSFRLLQQNFSSNSKLVLVGNGPAENNLRKYSQKIGISEKVIFAGPQMKLLPVFFRIAKLSVLPTFIESFGLVLLESLAVGTPAIGFKYNGREVLTATHEIIDDGITGKIIETPTAQALANGMHDILKLNNDEYHKMQHACIANIENNYSWNSFCKKMLDISI